MGRPTLATENVAHTQLVPNRAMLEERTPDLPQETPQISPNPHIACLAPRNAPRSRDTRAPSRRGSSQPLGAMGRASAWRTKSEVHEVGVSPLRKHCRSAALQSKLKEPRPRRVASRSSSQGELRHRPCILLVEHKRRAFMYRSRR